MSRYRNKTYLRIPGGEIQYGHLSRRLIILFRGHRWTLECEREARRRIEQTTAALISGELKDEELSRILLGSALGPEFYDPSTNAATECDA